MKINTKSFEMTKTDILTTHLQLKEYNLSELTIF